MSFFDLCFGALMLGFLFIALVGFEGMFYMFYKNSKPVHKWVDRFLDRFPDFED